MTLVIGCRARLCAVVNDRRIQLHPQRRLTVGLHFNDDDGMTSSLIVRDQSNASVRQIFLESEVLLYTVRRRHLHEISLREGHTLLLRLDRCDANAWAFRDAIEDVARRLDIFSSSGQARDSDDDGGSSSSSSSSSSSCESDDDSGPFLGATAAVRRTRSRIQTMWDCASCHLANRRDQMQCGECLRHRNDAWKCSCSRVYRLEKRRCSWCDIWRCHLCTFLNEATSPDRCYGCGSDRIL